MKRTISLLMAVLCLVMLSGAAFAEEDATLSPKQSEAVSLMNDIGIFQRIPEEQSGQAVSRAEFARIIVNMLGVQNELSKTPRRIYTDVLPEHDAAASIEYLYDRGIMIGYDNADFKPDEIITVGEVVKVMVTITGYADWAENAGGFPDGYYSQAVTNDMLRGVSGKIAEQISYADAAVIIQNILESRDYIKTTGYGKNGVIKDKNNDEAYMSYKLNIYSYTGMVETYGETSLEGSYESYQSNVVKIGGEMLEAGSIDFSDYIGMRVKVYYKADNNNGNTALHVVIDSKTSYLDIQDTDIADSTTKSGVNYYVDNKQKTAKIADDAIFICNGKRLDVVSDADLLVSNGSIRLISNSGKSTYDVVIIKSYETFIVDKAMAADCAVTTKYDRGTFDFDDDFLTTYYADGAEADFSSITAGSVLSVAFSKNTSGDVLAKVYISNNQITGKAVSLQKDGKRSVKLDDGNIYDFTDDYEARIEEGEANTYEPMINEEGTYYIDYFNRCAGFVLSVASKNYAYVVRCWYDENTETGSMRLFTKDGEFKDFDFAENISVNGTKTAKSQIPEKLKQTGENGTVHQLVIYKSNDDDSKVTKIETAENKIGEGYYTGAENEFILNDHPKNDKGIECGVRFYKNLAENKPYTFVDGKTVQFMIPSDKTKEKQYKIATKLSTTDVSLPAPLYFYDAGAGGSLGAVVSNTTSSSSYNTPVIIDKVIEAIDDEGDECCLLQFVGGSSEYVDPDVQYFQPGGTWNQRVDYTNVTVKDLKRGDVIEYTTANEKINQIRVVVRVDDVGPIRINGDHIQRSGNMIAEIVSVSENGRTAWVRYMNSSGVEVNQTMLVNGTTYRYESSDGKVYNSSSSDLRKGDKVLINSFWWSPKLVVIFR